MFIFYPSLNLTAFLFLYYLFLCFMYICLFYHMSITYACVYIILYTKTFDSLLYHFIVSNQSTSSLLIKTCNTINIFYQINKFKSNHVFTGDIISIMCYCNGTMMYEHIIFLHFLCTGGLPCIGGSCALLLFNLHSIVFNLIILLSQTLYAVIQY